MTQRRQFLQAAAVTPFALGAVPYVRTKPSWYLEPEDRVLVYKNNRTPLTIDRMLHRRMGQYYSPQDPSVDWSTSNSVKDIVDDLLGKFSDFYDSNQFFFQRAKVIASSFWDFRVPLDTEVPVAVDRGIVSLTAAELLELEDISKHPKLQYTPCSPIDMTLQSVFERNGFQPQSADVGDVVWHPGSVLTYNVVKVEGSEMWLDAKHISGKHVPDTRRWMVIPEAIPSKGHKLEYGDLVVPTLAAHRREPLEDMVATKVYKGLDKVNNTFAPNGAIFESDELIFLGHDPRPQVIYDDLT